MGTKKHVTYALMIVLVVIAAMVMILMKAESDRYKTIIDALDEGGSKNAFLYKALSSCCITVRNIKGDYEKSVFDKVLLDKETQAPNKLSCLNLGVNSYHLKITTNIYGGATGDIWEFGDTSIPLEFNKLVNVKEGDIITLANFEFGATVPDKEGILTPGYWAPNPDECKFDLAGKMGLTTIGPPPECSFMEPLVSLDNMNNPTKLTVKFTDNTDKKCGDIEIRKDSCTGTKVASCDVSSGVATAGMLCEVTFDLPATAGDYTYYACSGTYESQIITVTI